MDTTKILLSIRGIRLRRKTFVKVICLTSVITICLSYIEIQNWTSTSFVSKAKMKTDDQDQIDALALMLKVSPSAVFVLPNSHTVLRNSRSHCNENNGSNVLSLFMVVSSPSNKAARDVIRSGFKFHLGKHKNAVAEYLGVTSKRNTLLFFMGLPENSIEKQNLFEEAGLYQDVIIDDFQESVFNLTLKTMRLLKWVELNCYNADFTVKVDDDFHINLRKLVELFEAMSREESGKRLVGGKLFNSASGSSSPQTLLEQWPNTTFPDSFISGFFYVMGQKARSKIYREALLHPLFPLEDVFITGIIAKQSAGLRLTHFPKIWSTWAPYNIFFVTSCYIQKHCMGVRFHSKMFKYMDSWKDFNANNYICNEWPLIINNWL